MTVDPTAAVAFVAAHGRLLDRRRLRLLVGGGDAGGVASALDGYRNTDGGYGWGLEPDLRSPESQPLGAMHALEVLAELATHGPSVRPVEICDWLDSIAFPDGGLPLALPVTDGAGCAPLWLDADHTTPSLQMTTQVAANAHLVGRHDPAVRAHPWLHRATAWCLAAIAAVDSAPLAHELMFAVRFLDAIADIEPQAGPLTDQLGSYIPADGVVPVQGGVEDEALRALDLAPRPSGPARRLFSDGTIDAELRRLADAQEPDGGWVVDFVSVSPAATLEWRGYATVQAITILRGYDALLVRR
jgi:hypothetical protein